MVSLAKIKEDWDISRSINSKKFIDITNYLVCLRPDNYKDIIRHEPLYDYVAVNNFKNIVIDLRSDVFFTHFKENLIDMDRFYNIIAALKNDHIVRRLIIINHADLKNNIGIDTIRAIANYEIIQKFGRLRIIDRKNRRLRLFSVKLK